MLSVILITSYVIVNEYKYKQFKKEEKDTLLKAAELSEAISINGHVFDEAVWLKFSNMFIVSAIVLIVGAIGLILYSTIKRHL